jgi:hypothetical protein
LNLPPDKTIYYWRDLLYMTSGSWPTWCTVLLYKMFISIPYMFRANTCSSSGGQLY